MSGSGSGRLSQPWPDHVQVRGRRTMIAVDPQPHLWHSLSDGLGAQPSLMLGILVRCMTGANNGGPNSCAVRRAALHAGSKQVAVLSPQGTPAYADESHA